MALVYLPEEKQLFSKVRILICIDVAVCFLLFNFYVIQVFPLLNMISISAGYSSFRSISALIFLGGFFSAVMFCFSCFFGGIKFLYHVPGGCSRLLAVKFFSLIFYAAYLHFQLKADFWIEKFPHLKNIMAVCKTNNLAILGISVLTVLSIVSVLYLVFFFAYENIKFMKEDEGLKYIGIFLTKIPLRIIEFIFVTLFFCLAGTGYLVNFENIEKALRMKQADSAKELVFQKEYLQKESQPAIKKTERIKPWQTSNSPTASSKGSKGFSAVQQTLDFAKISDNGSAINIVKLGLAPTDAKVLKQMLATPESLKEQQEKLRKDQELFRQHSKAFAIEYLRNYETLKLKRATLNPKDKFFREISKEMGKYQTKLQMIGYYAMPSDEREVMQKMARESIELGKKKK